MSDDFVAHTGITWNGNVGTVQYGGGDRNLLVIFYTRPTHNPAKSTEHGRPIYEDKVFVRIQTPGERLNIVDRPANTTDQKRFPVQWAQFKENREQAPEGTPVDLLFENRPSIAAMLKASGVHTVEQLAALSGVAIDEIGMGAQQYVNEATKYIEMANKGINAAKFRHELEERDRTISSQQNQIDMLKKQLDKLIKDREKTVDLNTVQTLIAQSQGRPQFIQQPGPQFDAATAMINATSPTAEETIKRKRSRSRAKL